MKVLGVIVNIFLPGIGSLVVGQTTTGIVQFLLWLFGVLLTFIPLLFIVGIPICIVTWIWSIITAANSPDKPRPRQNSITASSPQPRRSQNSSVANFSLPQISLPNFPNLSQSSRNLVLVTVVGLALAGGLWRLHSLGYLDLSSKKVTPSVSTQSNAEICKNALDGSQTGWDRNDSYSWVIKEALARRLSIGDCRVLLGLSRDIMATKQTNVPPSIQQQQVTLLDQVIASNWAVGGQQNCSQASRLYSASADNDVVRWQDGLGRLFVESITYSGTHELRTTTIQSPSDNPGMGWRYVSRGANVIDVYKGSGTRFTIYRCF